MKNSPFITVLLFLTCKLVGKSVCFSFWKKALFLCSFYYILWNPFLYAQVISDKNIEVRSVAANASFTCRRFMAAGLHREGRTFISWSGPALAPYVRMFDHKNGEWSVPVKIADFTSTDYHDYCHIIASNDNKLHVFWSHHNRQMYHAISSAHLDITPPWKTKVIANECTYPMPFVSSDGTMFVFYRVGHHVHRPIHYRFSSDNGKTWTAPREAIVPQEPDSLNEVYIGTIKHRPPGTNRNERFMLSWTLAGGQYHNQIHKNLYFAYFDPVGKVFEDISGEKITSNIRGAELASFLILETSQDSIKNFFLKDRKHALEYTSNQIFDPVTGHPVVFYELWNDEKQHFAVKSARWTGLEWRHTLIAEKANMRDTEILPDGTILAYCTDGYRKIAFDKIIAYASIDHGESWTPRCEIDAPENLIGCYIIENYHPEIKYLLEGNTGRGGEERSSEGKFSIYVAGE